MDGVVFSLQGDEAFELVISDWLRGEREKERVECASSDGKGSSGPWWGKYERERGENDETMMCEESKRWTDTE